MRDFEIQIRKPLEDGSCPVTVHVPAEDRRAEGTFRPPFDDAGIDRALAWMEQGRLDDADIKRFGARLFRALFAGDIKDIYDGSREHSPEPLRYRLIIDSPAVARIPWELLYDPERQVFLALEGALVRGLSLREPTRLLEVKPPLRLLVIDAFPRGVLKVQGQLEAMGIQRALAGPIRSGQVEVVTLPNVSLDKLQNVLRDAASGPSPRPFHILHFVGHGYHDPHTGRTLLLFEDDKSEIDRVDPEALVNILRPYDLKLVFLNACQSVEWSALQTTEGFAPALMASGVPAVIGMQVTVLDEVAAAFARSFYAALSDNQPADAALSEARRLVASLWERRKADLGVPVCYLRTETGQILQVQKPAQVRLSRETLGPWLRQQLTPGRAVGALLALIGLAASIVGLYDFILPRVQAAKPMAGDINVAVAEFGELDAQGHVVQSDVASALSESVFEDLNTELKTLSEGLTTEKGRLLFEVRPPDRVGRIKGITPRERATSAADLARDIQADVVVYGNLKPGEGTDDFVPEFYVSDRQLPDAEELTGQYGLGSPVEEPGDVHRNPLAREELRTQLIARTRALSQFVIGLGCYALGKLHSTPEEAQVHFAKAESYFRKAADTKEWADQDGKWVLYHFLGNTALVQSEEEERLCNWEASRKKLKDAKGYYQHALDLSDQGYSRSLVGVAQLTYLHAIADCTKEKADIASLRQAITETQKALTAPIQPALSDIPAKAAYMIGRTQLCLNMAGAETDWTVAEDAFRQVTTAYEQADPDARIRLKSLAAESHAYLGLLYWVRPGQADGNYKLALDEYQQAIDLSQRKDRQAIFHSARGQLYVQQKECAQADGEFQQAADLDPVNRANYEDQKQRFHQQCVSSTPAPTATPRRECTAGPPTP